MQRRPIHVHAIWIQEHHRPDTGPSSLINLGHHGFICVGSNDFDISTETITRELFKCSYMPPVGINEYDAIKRRLGVESNASRALETLNTGSNRREADTAIMPSMFDSSLPCPRESINVPELETPLQGGRERA